MGERSPPRLKVPAFCVLRMFSSSIAAASYEERVIVGGYIAAESSQEPKGFTVLCYPW
jgi:hypothetical protein